MLERWTRWVLRHRTLVVACWLAVLGLGVWASTGLSARLANSFSVPGSDSDRAARILERAYGERTDGGFVVVFRVHHVENRRVRANLRRRLRLAAQSVPTGKAGQLREGAGVLYAEVGTRLPLHRAKAYTDDVRRALRTGDGPQAYVTGQPAIQRDVDPILAGDLRRGEAIAVPAALVALLLVLGASLAVAVPFVVAACTISATLAVVYGLAHLFPIVTYVTNLVELIGLGLAVDYALLVVHRYREELRAGSSVEDAVVRTTLTAGRAVVFSGTAVALGLAVLLLTPVPFIRSIGVGGLLVPVASVAAALTLQPALLSLLGRRGAARRPVPWSPRTGTDFWARLARTIMRRPRLFLAAGAALLVAAAVPAGWLEVTPGSFSSLPASPESSRGYALLQERVGPGVALPIQVVVDSGRPGGARRGPVAAAVERLADELFQDPEVFIVASAPKRPYLDPTGRYARVVVAARDDYGAPAVRALVDRLRDRLVPRARFPDGVPAYTGGVPAQGVDFLSRTYGPFPWLVAGLLVVTFLVLLRAFRSIVLPLKAVVLNVVTVAAVYGLLVVVFDGQRIDGWVPVLLFATLFGLSMDYEVFLVSRMRETWDETRDGDVAVERGLERTGRIVTAAAAIMVVAFTGFAIGRVAPLRQFGVGLILAVALDATLVRMVLVPSLMAVLGRRNWWLPAPVARLARVARSDT